MRRLKFSDLALYGTAGVGLFTLVWIVGSWIFGWTLVVITTGSMSPSLPQGSVAIAVPVAASDIAVGDVLTLPQEGRSLPVTHRVVAISESAQGPHMRRITMRGDDNPVDDPRPYEVSEGLRTIAGLPHAGKFLIMLKTPVAMGVVTLCVAAVVIVALWPSRKQEKEKDHKSASASPSTATHS